MQVRRHRGLWKTITWVLTEVPELLWKGTEVTELNTCMEMIPGRAEKKGGAHFSLATLCALRSCSDTICVLSWAMAPGKEVCACLRGASRGCY